MITTKLGALILAAAMTLASVGTAHADLFQCGYPATGYYVRADVIIVTGIVYVCDFPQEINGAHLHQELISVDVGFNVAGNFPNLFGAGNAGNIGANGITIGGAGWSSSWRCPDERYLAKQPNPVGAWNRPMRPSSCEAIGVAGLSRAEAPWPPIKGSTDLPVVVPPALDPGSPPPEISAPQPAPPPPVYMFGPQVGTNLNPTAPDPVSPKQQGSS